jgi:putative DNA primase/helicase
MEILEKISDPLTYLGTLPKEKGLEESKKFVYEVLRHKPKSFGTTFIGNELKSYFGLNDDDLRNIKLLYKEQKTTFKDIGDYILKRYSIFTLRDTQEICFYRKGVYIIDKSKTYSDKRIREISKDFNFLANQAFVKEVLAYIQSQSYIDRDKIDAGNYINFQNGLLNLDTWELEPHRKDYLSIRQIPLVYDPDATCPMIEKFISEVVVPADVPIIYEWFGLSLIPETKFCKAMLFYGDGSNGKTVLLNLLADFVGIESISGESLQKLGNDKHSTANLYGKLMNICPDIPDTKLQSTAIFKQLTGDDCFLRGEEKYKPAFYFKNTARLIFSANHLPKGDIDYAFSRRWILIHFPNTFENGDKDLFDKLKPELSGLLNLALEGLQRLQSNGKFSNSKSIEETQREYILNMDSVAMFLEECTYSSGEDTEQETMHYAYTRWALANKMKSLDFNPFCKGMKEHKVEKYRFTHGSIKVPKFLNISLDDEYIKMHADLMKSNTTGAKAY